jgi:hypothetical protein
VNIIEAIHCLRENEEKLPDEIPAWLFSDVRKVVKELRRQDWEELQQRSNQGWEDLISEESDPLEAAKLLLDWLADQTRALEKHRGYQEEANLTDSERMSR